MSKLHVRVHYEQVVSDSALLEIDADELLEWITEDWYGPEPPTSLDEIDPADLDSFIDEFLHSSREEWDAHLPQSDGSRDIYRVEVLK